MTSPLQQIASKVAERVGFEPTVLQNSTHDFQSCQFNQLLHLSVKFLGHLMKPRASEMGNLV